MLSEISNSSVIDSIVRTGKNVFTDKETKQFSDVLQKYFSEIDTDKNNSLSVSEIKNKFNEADNKDIENLVSKLDLNQNNELSLKELDTKSSVSEVFQVALSGLLQGKNKSEILSQSLTNLGKAYRLNDFAVKTAESLIEKIV